MLQPVTPPDPPPVLLDPERLKSIHFANCYRQHLECAETVVNAYTRQAARQEREIADIHVLLNVAHAALRIGSGESAVVAITDVEKQIAFLQTRVRELEESATPSTTDSYQRQTGR